MTRRGNRGNFTAHLLGRQMPDRAPRQPDFEAAFMTPDTPKRSSGTLGGLDIWDVDRYLLTHEAGPMPTYSPNPKFRHKREAGPPSG